MPPAGDDSIDLGDGANLVTWPNSDSDPRDLVETFNGDLVAIYGYDVTTGQWLRYSPSLPAYANTLGVIARGYPYWFLIAGPAQLRVDD